MRNYLINMGIVAVTIIGMQAVSDINMNADGKTVRNNNGFLLGPNNAVGVNKNAQKTVNIHASGNNKTLSYENNQANSEYRNIGGVIDCICDSTFSVGDVVVALVDSPSFANGILAGDTGTVVCGSLGVPPILVWWDNWHNGHNNTLGCDCGDSGAPLLDEGWYVNCDEIEIDLGEPPTGACCYTDPDLGWTCTYATETDCLALTNGYWYGSGTTCGIPPVECDLPSETGACCYTDPDLGWTCTYATEADCLALTNGYWYGSGTTCGVPPVECDLPSDPTGACCLNGTCQEISETDCLDMGGSYEGDSTACADTNCGGGGDVDCACDAAYSVGDTVVALVDDPSGATGVLAGMTGTVVCGYLDPGNLELLIAWDGWAGGHDGNGFCQCGAGDPPTDNGWWVACNVITYVSIPCQGDLNGDGVIDVSDLLKLIAAWGPCP